MHEHQEKESYYVAAVFLAIVLTAIVTVAACGQVASNKWDIVTGVSTAIYTTITAFLLFLAAKQFKLHNDVAAADFALKFKHDFFTEETRGLISLLDYDQLELVITTDKFAYFKIKPKTNDGVSCHDFIHGNRNKYSSYEMDDWVLNHLEDVWVFYTKGALSLDYVYQGFSYYIEVVIENDEIKKYLKWLRKEVAPDLYEGLEMLCHAVKEEAVRRNSDKEG